MQFLTVLPIRNSFEAAEIGRSVAFFPIAGALIGGVIAVLDYFVFSAYFPPAVSAMMAVIALASASGGLHLDGVADTADGFFSSQPKARILEIMRDSRIGSMGVLALLAVLGLKAAALAYLPDPQRWRAILLAPTAGRSMLVAAMTRAPYARPEGGLATVFLEYRKPWHALWAVSLLIVASATLWGWRGIVLAALCVIATAVFNGYARRKIGGITGDTLGAVCELVETGILLAALVVPL